MPLLGKVSCGLRVKRLSQLRCQLIAEIRPPMERGRCILKEQNRPPLILFHCDEHLDGIDRRIDIGLAWRHQTGDCAENGQLRRDHSYPLTIET